MRAFVPTYRASVLKALRRMQPAKAKDIVQALAQIAADPKVKNPNVKPLRSIKNGFRVRVGDWRASYTLDREAHVMDVFEVAPRGSAYR